MLHTINNNLKHAVNNAALLPSNLVDSASEEGSEYSTRQETAEEESGDVDTVGKVEGVHVSALHPVGEHDYEVDCEVLHLESGETFA